MYDKISDTELVAPLYLDHHGLDRPLPERFVRAGKIDQVRTMRDGITDSGLHNRLTERAGLFTCQCRGLPLIAVLSEDLNGLEAQMRALP